MPNHRMRVQYPELNGSEQHHDLKNRPGDNGDPDHARDDDKTVIETESGTGKED